MYEGVKVIPLLKIILYLPIIAFSSVTEIFPFLTVFNFFVASMYSRVKLSVVIF